MEGMIFRALSGFYDVQAGDQVIRCRARGKFRHQKVSPLVGDRVAITQVDEKTGMVDEILPRKNFFLRPAVANMDQLIIIASRAIPETDPFLIDRVVSLAEKRGCEPVIVVNKCDLAPGEPLAEIYRRCSFRTILTSAETGQGVEELRDALAGKTSVFTGNSGVGKSSLLNQLAPELNLQTGEVSKALGRGRHTTRHIELYRLENGGVIADTPGFSSFDSDQGELCRKEDLAETFREFRPYLGQCRFVGCAHVKEKGCAVLAAVKAGDIPKTRHQSYVRLYEQAKEIKEWEWDKKN
jgi:ribosome biogenesis GTPase